MMAAQDSGQEEKKVARRVAPTSLLFDYTVLSAFDDVDKVRHNSKPILSPAVHVLSSERICSSTSWIFHT